MKSSNVYLITDLDENDKERTALILGPNNHSEAVDLYSTQFPERKMLAVISAKDLETTLRRVNDAIREKQSEYFSSIVWK